MFFTLIPLSYSLCSVINNISHLYIMLIYMLHTSLEWRIIGSPNRIYNPAFSFSHELNTLGPRLIRPIPISFISIPLCELQIPGVKPREIRAFTLTFFVGSYLWSQVVRSQCLCPQYLYHMWTMDPGSKASENPGVYIRTICGKIVASIWITRQTVFKNRAHFALPSTHEHQPRDLAKPILVHQTSNLRSPPLGAPSTIPMNKHST